MNTDKKMTITATRAGHPYTDFRNIPSYHYFHQEFEPIWEPLFINHEVIIAWCDCCQHPITRAIPYEYLGDEIYLCQPCAYIQSDED